MSTVLLEQSASTTEKSVTAEELLEYSRRDDRRYELLRGELVMMSPAGGKHGDLTMRLGAKVQTYVEEMNLGYTFAAETGFLLETDPDTVRAPDVSFVSAERLPAGPPATYLAGAPDLAVEVVSPNDTASAVQSKVQDWLRHGSRLVWVVEPETETVTVYREDGSVELLKRGDSVEGEEVLPGFSYTLERLFA